MSSISSNRSTRPLRPPVPHSFPEAGPLSLTHAHTLFLSFSLSLYLALSLALSLSRYFSLSLYLSLTVSTRPLSLSQTPSPRRAASAVPAETLKQGCLAPQDPPPSPHVDHHRCKPTKSPRIVLKGRPAPPSEIKHKSAESLTRALEGATRVPQVFLAHNEAHPLGSYTRPVYIPSVVLGGG